MKPKQKNKGNSDPAIFCAKCGNKLLPDSAFCERCGTSASGPTVANMQKVSPGNEVSKGIVILFVVLGVLLILIMVRQQTSLTILKKPITTKVLHKSQATIRIIPRNLLVQSLVAKTVYHPWVSIAPHISV